MMLELGGGTSPHRRADIVIDLRHPKGTVAQDAAVTPWLVQNADGLDPVSSESVDEVYCSHFMEHIPKGQPTIDVMNEAWRVLKPGGTFTMLLPLVGHEVPGEGPRLVQSYEPYADPTHVQLWYFPQSLLYFVPGSPYSASADYDMRPWHLGSYVEEPKANVYLKRSAMQEADRESFWGVRGGWEGVARLIKVSRLMDLGE